MSSSLNNSPLSLVDSLSNSPLSLVDSSSSLVGSLNREHLPSYYSNRSDFPMKRKLPSYFNGFANTTNGSKLSFFLAASEGDSQLLKIFIERGIDINSTDNVIT